MADKMMRIAGRGNDGLAKPIKTNNNGDILTRLVGSDVDISERMAYTVGELTLLDIPTYDGSGQAVHPSVVHIPKGFGGYKFWMAFTPYPNSDDQMENPSVAASNDGITWVVPPGIVNPLAETPAGVAYNRDAEIVHDIGNKKLRVYWGNSLNGAYFREISPDLTVGAPIALTGNPVPFGGSQASIIRLSATEWVAFAQNNSLNDNVPFSMTRFKSSDGIAWAVDYEAKTNLLSPIWHLGVTYTAEGFHFLALAYPKGLVNDKELFYGFSVDGEYIAFDSTPLVTRDLAGWLSDMVYKSHLVRYGKDTYRVYVSGLNLTGEWRMGYVDIKTNNPSAKASKILQGLPPRTVTLFEKLALRSTERYHYVIGGGSTARAIPEFSLYKHKAISIYSTVNQAVTITLRGNMRNVAGWDPMFCDDVAQSITINADANKNTVITAAKLAALGALIPHSVTVSVQAVTTAPTAGEITVILKAWN